MSNVKKKEDRNIFETFSSEAEEREKQQKHIEAIITGTTSSPSKRTTMQIAMSDEDKIALKTYAAHQHKPVSAIIHEWITKHCHA